MKKALMILLLQVILFSAWFISAQSMKDIMLTNGVIYTKTDTIKCLISIEDNFQFFVKYKIKMEDQNFQRINTDHIILLKRGVNTYKNLEYKGQNQLLKVDVEGKVSLYERTISGNTSPGSSTGSGMYMAPSIPSEPRIYYISDGIQICKLNRSNYKNEIKKMLAGGESFYEAIDRLKYDQLWIELSRIISNYNFKTSNT
jgi:hypothetical protein